MGWKPGLVVAQPRQTRGSLRVRVGGGHPYNPTSAGKGGGDGARVDAAGLLVEGDPAVHRAPGQFGDGMGAAHGRLVVALEHEPGEARQSAHHGWSPQQQTLATGPRSHREEPPTETVPPIFAPFHKSEVDQRLQLPRDDRLVTS